MTRKRLLAISLLAGLVLWTAPGVRPSAFQAAELESLSFAKEGPAVAVSVQNSAAVVVNTPSTGLPPGQEPLLNNYLFLPSLKK